MGKSFSTTAVLVTLLPAITGCGRKTTVAVPDARTLGADCPWTTQQAEHCGTNAPVMGPSVEYLKPQSEASGRSYVSLQRQGDYLEFKAAKAANAIVLRYSIPDAPTGGGTDATLSLDINGKFARKLNLASRYSWIYGDFPWSNDPSKGKAHHFFDESRALIPDAVELYASVSPDSITWRARFVRPSYMVIRMPSTVRLDSACPSSGQREGSN